MSNSLSFLDQFKNDDPLNVLTRKALCGINNLA